MQEEDLDIRKAVDLLKRNQLLHYRNNRQDTNEFKSLMKSRHHLKLIEGILYRNVQLKHQPKEVQQLVLPKPLRKRMVLACHDEMGHMGMDRVLLLLQDRVFWPGMAKDVRIHIRTCERCERFKTPKDLKEALQTEASYPLELIHVDFLQIGGKKDVRKDINVLVVTDHFTRYAQGYVTNAQTAIVTAKVLVERFFLQHGWPTKLVSDQGPGFESKLFQELMREADIKKIRTTPYQPQGNAQCERFNRTLLSMLGTMPPENKKNWQEWVSTMTHAYNCTVSRATGFSPYLLMFGRIPRIPIDNELNLPTQREEADSNTYAARLLSRLDQAFHKARENIAKDQVQRKAYFDQNVWCHKLEPGDIVLVRKNAFGSDYKIADKWEEEPHEVISQYKNFPVFIIQSVVDQKAKEWVLHRNMLHPARSIEWEEVIVDLQEGPQQEVLAKANCLMEIYFQQ